MERFSGKDYLRIDIANNFGLDKLTWKERIQWVHDNSNLEKYIPDADNPFGYQKAVYTYREVMKGNPTGHIMFLDATSSFLQIMSIFSNDRVGAEQSNIINTGKRQDFYTNLTNTMNSYLDTNVQITRQDIKEVSMP